MIWGSKVSITSPKSGFFPLVWLWLEVASLVRTTGPCPVKGRVVTSGFVVVTKPEFEVGAVWEGRVVVLPSLEVQVIPSVGEDAGGGLCTCELGGTGKVGGRGLPDTEDVTMGVGVGLPDVWGGAPSALSEV